jgi:hypothetical protein
MILYFDFIHGIDFLHRHYSSVSLQPSVVTDRSPCYTRRNWSPFRL